MSDPHQIFPNLDSIAENYTGILLDAYGVFWGGNAFGLLPGSKEIMEKLVSKGKIVGILSNSTQLAAKEINKFQQQGIIKEKHFHFLVTSGEVARDIFKRKITFSTPHKKFWVFGAVHPRFSSHEPIFQGTPYTETTDLSQADFIYTGIPHIQGEDQTDPEIFRQAIHQLPRQDLPMVCPNPDCFAHEGNPPKAVVRQGSVAALYEKMGGHVYYIGKPYESAYAITMRNFLQHKISNPKEILMVGDTPETDIRGARKMGMASALIIETGIMADRISHQGLEAVLQNLSQHDFPDYLIGRLAHDV